MGIDTTLQDGAPELASISIFRQATSPAKGGVQLERSQLRSAAFISSVSQLDPGLCRGEASIRRG
ncbi:hypothetical protein ASE69_09570 [Sphingomonas sp. Leaf208]|nr:hypothetical protein ASE69_09570 [Sphingomonas sp. Leaf208]